MKRILLNPIFYVRNFYFKDKTKNLVAFLNILGLTCLLKMNKRQSVMSKQCDLTGKKFQNGNNVSHAKNRTKKKFIPNLQFTSFFSDKLKKKIQLKVATSTIRTVEKNGGIDKFLSKTPTSKLSSKAKLLKKRISIIN
mgnify:CR=1 FL=1